MSDIVIPEEARETAAKAACEATYPPNSTGRAKAHDSWDEIEEWERNAWRATVGAALEAALPALRRQWAEEVAQALEHVVASEYADRADISIDRAAAIIRECGEARP